MHPDWRKFYKIPGSTPQDFQGHEKQGGMRECHRKEEMGET